MKPEHVAILIAAIAVLVVFFKPALGWLFSRNQRNEDTTLARLENNDLRIENNVNRIEIETLRSHAALQERVSLTERTQVELSERLNRMDGHLGKIADMLNELLRRP